MGPMAQAEIVPGELYAMGIDIVEVVEIRDRGYCWVCGNHYEGLTPAANLRPLTQAEIDALEHEQAGAPVLDEEPLPEDDAESLQDAAFELAARVWRVSEQHGREYVYAVPIFGGQLAALEAAAAPHWDAPQGEADMDDSAIADEEIPDGPSGNSIDDLPPPGPGAAAAVTGDLPARGWSARARRRPAAPPVAPVPVQNSPAPYGVATLGPVGQATTTAVRATVATVSPPVERSDASAPIVNGTAPLTSHAPAAPVPRGRGPAPRPAPQRPANPQKTATVSPPVPRPDD